nr:increased DNA methylation 1-like [Tanacetum cinerariifolium]
MVRQLHQQDQTNDLEATPHMLASTSSCGTCQPTYTCFTPLHLHLPVGRVNPHSHVGRKFSKFGNSEAHDEVCQKVNRFGENESEVKGEKHKMNVDLDKENTSQVLGVKSSRSLMEDDGLDLRLYLSNGNEEEDVDENENVGLRRKTGSLKVLVNKHKSVGNGQVNDLKEAKSGLLERKKVKLDRGVSEGRDANKKSVDLSGLKHSKKKVVSSSSSSKKVAVKLKKRTVVESDKEMDESNVDAPPRSKVEVEKREGNTKSGTKQVALVKGKETKIKGASYTEKQLLREKIKKMLFGAGWTIDYRPRRGRDYLDSVYMSPSGTGYWSITKAYEALQKEEKNSSKDGKDFTPLPNEMLSKLTRQTRRKEEKVSVKNKKREGDSSKSKKAKVKVLKDVRKVSENKVKEVLEDSEARPLRYDTPKKSVGTNSHIVDERKHRALGRLALLVRGYNHGSNSEDNEEVYSGKRTLISWLIDSGMISIGEKVEYMNLRKRRVMEEGYITEDGIQCGCCSKTVTISRFELHAGSKLGQPFQNIYVKSGKSLLQCQIDAWNKQKESERKGFHAVDIEGEDPNDDTCGLCGDGGDLICCDGCPSTFHLSCLDMQMLPQGDWHCPDCVCKHCEKVGWYRTKSGVRTKRPLLTCRLCVKKYHKSCSSEIEDTPVTSNNPNFSFCGQNCRELYSRIQKLLWIKHDLGLGFSWSLIHRSDSLPDVSSANYSRRVECNSKLAIALSVMDECFLPIVDTRSGITLIHNVVYNCGSNFSRLNYSGFFTAILERGDEMICAASIRIHGSQLAEMPFIGTRHLYRRQGMCRRLLDAIESALSSLEVEKLVIPAIEEHRHTWTEAFGFSPLKKSQKQEMRFINMLVFPGTDLLQKPLMKQGTPESNVTSETGKKSVELKESELTDTAVQNGDYTRKKSNAQSDTNVLQGVVHAENGSTKGKDGGTSGPISEATDLQNGNDTATRVIDANSLQPKVPDGASHNTASTEVSCESQLQVAAKVSVSVDAHSDSTHLLNGNVTNSDLEFQRKESACVNALSMFMAKKSEVQDATNRNI